MHSEGGVWMMLFSLLMWEILFADVPDVCQTSFQDIPVATINELKNRKLIEARNDTWYSLKKGPNYAPKRVKPETDLTRELLQSGEWLNREFKPYNFNALGQPTEGSHLHPLLKIYFIPVSIQPYKLKRQ